MIPTTKKTIAVACLLSATALSSTKNTTADVSALSLKGICGSKAQKSAIAHAQEAGDDELERAIAALREKHARKEAIKKKKAEIKAQKQAKKEAKKAAKKSKKAEKKAAKKRAKNLAAQHYARSTTPVHNAPVAMGGLQGALEQTGEQTDAEADELIAEAQVALRQMYESSASQIERLHGLSDDSWNQRARRINSAGSGAVAAGSGAVVSGGAADSATSTNAAVVATSTIAEDVVSVDDVVAAEDGAGAEIFASEPESSTGYADNKERFEAFTLYDIRASAAKTSTKTAVPLKSAEPAASSKKTAVVQQKYKGNTAGRKLSVKEQAAAMDKLGQGAFGGARMPGTPMPIGNGGMREIIRQKNTVCDSTEGFAGESDVFSDEQYSPQAGHAAAAVLTEELAPGEIGHAAALSKPVIARGNRRRSTNRGRFVGKRTEALRNKQEYESAAEPEVLSDENSPQAGNAAAEPSGNSLFISALSNPGRARRLSPPHSKYRRHVREQNASTSAGAAKPFHRGKRRLPTRQSFKGKQLGGLFSI